MRSFNKVFVVSLPRCATVTMSNALGMLGIRTAHLGKIYGEESSGHNNPARLSQMHQQITASDFQLDVLDECEGLADYPVCCMPVLEALDQQYPGSLFINVRRDANTRRWLQSVERQFVGLELLSREKKAGDVDRDFLNVMLQFRSMTFGSHQFNAPAYLDAYQCYQGAIGSYFANRPAELLTLQLEDLNSDGFRWLSKFLERDAPQLPTFPNSNQHSQQPSAAFMKAIQTGQIVSTTGISI